jgi:hypothetical protein
MKQVFTSLLLLAGSFQAISQTITWGTPIAVYSVDANHNNHPRVALNRSGDPYIIFGQTDTRVYFTKWNGTAFTTPTVASGALTVFSQSWAGPDLAAHGDTIYVAMKVTPEMTTTTNYTYLAHSYDGGASFSMPVRVDNIGTNHSRFPIVTTTSAGNPLVAFMKFTTAGTNAKYAVVRSSDYGMTFTPEVIASGTVDSVCDCCPASIVSSGSNALMLYRNNNGNIRDMWAGVSTDGGMTFPNRVEVDTTNWMITSCPSSGPDGFAIGDSLYTVFMSAASGTSLVYLSRASLSGLTAKHSRITGMFSGLTSQNYPRVDNTSNTAVAVWVQSASGSKYVACSLTGNISSGFSGYVTVPGSTSSGIMDADVAITPGAIHIVWEDDNSGKVMYVKGTYTLPSTSIEHLSKKEMIEAYPNPSSNDFTVSLNDVNSISTCFLTDNAGRNIELKPTIKNGKATFSLNGVAKGGYYFIMNDSAGKSYYSKLIVQ